MSIKHSLSFPIFEHETATSYISRLALYCGLTSPNDFCLDHGFRWQDLVRGDDVLFDKVASIGGADAAKMKRWAVRTIDRNRFAIAGQHATKMSLVRTRLRVCPKCLVEDRNRRGRFGAFRRHAWHLLSVRACAVHNVPLMSIEPEKYTIQNYDFAGLVQKHWVCIQAEAQASNSRSFTSMEHYICERLNGTRQVSFLDDMPMYITTRLCELLGFVLEFGPDRQISDGSEDDLSRSGQVGFEALRSGKAGLYTALDKLVSPIGLRTVRHRSDLGAFFEWLRNTSLSEEFDPLKDLVRDYVFRTYPCVEGDMVLGAACPETTRYSIHGAWQTLGIQRNRMNRILIAEGAAHKNDGDKTIQLKEALSFSDIDELSEKMASRLTVAEACDVLNVSADFLMQLRDRGIVTPVMDALDQVPKYERDILKGVLSKLHAQVTVDLSKQTDVVSIVEASRRLRCPAGDIVDLVLGGEIAEVSQDETIDGISGLRVSLPQVRGALPPIEMEGVTKGEASRLLRVTYPTINYFVSERLLDVAYVRNPKSRQFLHAVSDDSIAAFQHRFETLGHLANRFRRASGPLGCNLETKGICPIETPAGISWFYERKGLERRLQKVGLVEPSERDPI